MSMIKNIRQEFAEMKYIKDGCPESDARKETWESMVQSFYDGNEKAAIEEFNTWCGIN